MGSESIEADESVSGPTQEFRDQQRRDSFYRRQTATDGAGEEADQSADAGERQLIYPVNAHGEEASAISMSRFTVHTPWSFR